MSAIDDITAERKRQIEQEGWSANHDDLEHDDGALAKAAICYASMAVAYGRVSSDVTLATYRDSAEGRQRHRGLSTKSEGKLCPESRC